MVKDIFEDHKRRKQDTAENMMEVEAAELGTMAARSAMDASQAVAGDWGTGNREEPSGGKARYGSATLHPRSQSSYEGRSS